MKILITGTSTPEGIGQALARYLGARGHTLWGLARTPHDWFADKCRAEGISFRCDTCDVAQWEQVRSLRDRVAAEWGSLDALICCAGIQGALGPATSVEPARWAETIAINLTGTFHSLRAFHALLLRAERRGKAICFSGGGSTAPRPNFTAYAVAKAGLVRLVENLAHEWGSGSIDINAIAPGPVNTRMTQEVLGFGPAVVGEKEFEIATRQWKQGPTPVEQYAPCVEFLLSADSDGISGRLISSKWDPWPGLRELREELMRSDVFTLRRVVPEDRGKHWS